MTLSLDALFEEGRAALEPSATQIAIGRARLKAATAAPASGALGAAGIAGVGLIAIVLAFAATRGDVSAGTPPAAAPDVVVARVAATPVEPPAVAPAPAPVPAPEAAVASAEVRPRRSRAPAPATAEDPLARELRLVRDARAALTAHDLDAARVALDAHARAFADGQLAQEAALLGIELACASGDVSGARTSVLQFVERWPRSSKRARAERACPEEITDAP